MTTLRHEQAQPTSDRSIRSLLDSSWRRGRFLCVGLDPDYTMLPAQIRRSRAPGSAITLFNRELIAATHDFVCAYKPNTAFYEAHGREGLDALIDTVRFIRENYPHVLTILDAKRGDIGNTNRGYVTAAFDVIGADAITVHPYLGREALAPFIDRPTTGVFVLAKTSNPGAAEFQDLSVAPEGRPLYQEVARNVATNWNVHQNCGLVVGATYPAALRAIRALVDDLPILIPGIGRQGGEVSATVRAGIDRNKRGIIVNSSRDVIYASDGTDFAAAAARAAQTLNDEINRHL